MKYFSFVLIAALAALTASADPVSEIDYQGKVLVDDAAFTGTGYFKLALSDEASSTNLWSNDGTLSGEPTGVLTSEVIKGVFSMAIGDASMTALTPGIFSAGEDLYLRVWFSTNGTSFDEMLPSQKLLSAPYAINADQVDGYDYAEIRAGLATGTPLYAYSETDPVWLAQKSAYATGTPLYAETDPVWLAQKAGYATGTPVYAETDPLFTAVSNRIVYTNTSAGGDLGGTYPRPTVTGLQGRAVSSAAPGSGNVLQWNGSAWAPAVVSGGTGSVVGSAGGDLSGPYTNLYITKLQGATLFNAGSASPGQFLKFTGIRWEPSVATLTESDPIWAAVSNSVVYDTDAAGGDLAGAYPNPTVDGLLGRPLSTNPPSPNDLLIWDGTNWNATGLSGSAGYGRVNTMSAVLPGDPINVLGAGSVTVTDIPGPTNAVEISVPVPELQNVIWVAPNGTSTGPGNIDSPYNSVQGGYGAAVGKYAGSPAVLMIAAGVYSGTSNNLSMSNGNVHVFGLNRPIIGAVTVRAAADASLKSKQRIENVVISSAAATLNSSSGAKFRNCRILGTTSIQGSNIEFQDCFMSNVLIQGTSTNVGFYNCAVKKNGNYPFTISANGAQNLQVVGCEIVNSAGGVAVRGPTSATAVPPWHFSHNVIKGDVEPQSAATFLLNHNVIQGSLIPNSGPATNQYFANNMIIGTNNWVQAEPTATMDAYGNTVFITTSIPDPWND